MFAEVPFHSSPRNKDRPGDAVVGPFRIVLMDAAAELAEGHDDFGAASCYVVSADGERFQRRRIECEGTLESDMIVRRGLQADEVVVTVGAEQLAAEASKSILSVEDND